jgi:hypothetical protein
MKTFRNYPVFTLFCLSACCWFGCAAPYHFIEPQLVNFSTASADTLANRRGEIAWRYHVLADAGNRKYAKKEARSGISLLAVRVRNGSADTVFFPESVLMFAGRDTLQPLTMEAAGEALRQTTAEDGGQGVVEVEVDAPLANLAVDIFNIATQEKANLRFVKELQEFYLVPSYVAPGQTVAGLLALPVKALTPLRFAEHEDAN